MRIIINWEILVNTTCTLAQDAFDEKKLDGTLGYMEVRPTCDRNGLFSTFKCIPGEMYIK